MADNGGKIFNRDVRIGGGGALYVNEIKVIDEDGNVDAPVTTTDLTVSGTLAVTGASTFTGAVIASSTLAVTGTSTLTGKVTFGLNGGAASASGLFAGVGTTANPATTAAAGNWMEFRTESTATSGDARGLYWRHDLNGAGVSGEAIRAFAKISAACATARGAHISLDLAAAGSVSGFGAGVDAQVLYGDAAYTNTATALNAELYAAGSSSAISSGSGSFLRCVLNGDATGIADFDDNANLIVLTGGSIAGGNIVETETDETKFSHKIRCSFNGTTLYLMATAS